MRFLWCPQSSEEESRRLNGVTPSKNDSGQGKNSTTKEGGQSKNAAQKDGEKGKSGSGSNGVVKTTSAAATAAAATATTASTASTATPDAGGMLPPQPPRDASVTVGLDTSHATITYRQLVRILNIGSLDHVS